MANTKYTPHDVTRAAIIYLLCMKRRGKLLPAQDERVRIEAAARSSSDRLLARLLALLSTAHRLTSVRPGDPDATLRVWVQRGATLSQVALLNGVTVDAVHVAARRVMDALRSDCNGLRDYKDALLVVRPKPTRSVRAVPAEPTPRSKVTANVLTSLRFMALGNSSRHWTNRTFAEHLIVRFAHLRSLSPSTVSRWLTKRLNITRKMPSVIPLEAMRPVNLAKRREFARTHFTGVNPQAIGKVETEAIDMRKWQAVRDPRLVFCTDESGFNLMTEHRRLVCAPRGERAPATRQHDKGRNNSLVIVIGHRDGIVAKQIISGGYKTDDFVAFLEQHFCPYIRQYRTTLPDHLKNEEILFVADNASIHIGQRVRDVLSAAGATLTRLPPRYPELNPCENVFSNLKGRMRTSERAAVLPSVHIDVKRQMLRKRVMAHSAEIDAATIRGYYRRCAWGRFTPPADDVA